MNPSPTTRLNQRVRAILLTENQAVLFIKRVKPGDALPYWVAPGGGVEESDDSLLDTLHRELREELGARVEVLGKAFVLQHEKAGKKLEEHFFICRLIDYDLNRRHGPEFRNPDKGLYIPDEVQLDEVALNSVVIKTPELRDWLLEHTDVLRQMI